VHRAVAPPPTTQFVASRTPPNAEEQRWPLVHMAILIIIGTQRKLALFSQQRLLTVAVRRQYVLLPTHRHPEDHLEEPPAVQVELSRRSWRPHCFASSQLFWLAWLNGDEAYDAVGGTSIVCDFGRPDFASETCLWTCFQTRGWFVQETSLGLWTPHCQA